MLPIERVIGHREWSPGRKSDPVYDMNWRRAGVAGIQPKTTAPEDDMPTAREIADAILDTPITRQGDLLPPGGNKTTTTLRNELAYMTNESYRVANLAKRVDELAKRPGAEVDPAPIVDAVVEAITDAGMAQQVVDALAARLAKPAP